MSTRVRIPRRAASRQGGAAALLVVMALFFLVSMVAAYSSRNLVFEQRTSANQYRATQAMEVAEGGVEWAVALLNAGPVDATCTADVPAATSTFRTRYLNIDEKFGLTTPKRLLRSACVLTRGEQGQAWSCSCPDSAVVQLASPAAAEASPAFQVKLQQVYVGKIEIPGVFAIDSTGCTSPSLKCLDQGSGDGGEAAARVNVMVAVVPALATVPVAAVTVLQEVQISGGSGYAIVNDDANVGGITVHAGNAVGFSTGAVQLASVPGKPDTQSIIVPDATLAALKVDDDKDLNDFFRRFLGMSPRAFQRQAHTVRFPDPAVSACRDHLEVCVKANPGRPVWVKGDLELRDSVQVGTPDVPALLVVEGEVRLDDRANVIGVVYSRKSPQALNQQAQIRGALITEGKLSSPVNVQYDASVIARIRHGQGPVIRLPGGWKDF